MDSKVNHTVNFVLLTETPPLVQKSDKLHLWKTDTSEYLDIENAASANLLWKWKDFTRGQPLAWKKTKHSGFRRWFENLSFMNQFSKK